MSKILVFVGHIGKSYLDYFLSEGYTVGLFKDFNETEILTHEEKMDFIIPVNFQDRKSVELTLKGIRLKPETILLVLKDRYLLGASFIAEYLNLNQKYFLSVKLARNATNKIFQRKVFQTTFPEITPPAKKITTFHGAYTFVRKHGFPVIIKPAALSQSQLVNMCNDLESLITKVSYVLANVKDLYKKLRVYRSPQVGIETYIKGDQYSVDSYVTKDGEIIHTPVCRQIIGYDLGRNNFHTMYSMYTDQPDKEDLNIIYKTVEKAIKSLGILGNPTHTEVRINTETKECKIIEVNIRTGGYRAKMLKESYDIPHVRNVINNYLDSTLEVNQKLLKHSACPQFWSDKEGYLIEVNGIEEVKSLPSFVSLDKGNYKPGDLVGSADFGRPKLLHAILANADKGQLMKDIKAFNELLYCDVEPLKVKEEED